MGEKKDSLRDKLLLRRDSRSPSEVLLWNQVIQETALWFSPYRNSRAVALYSPIGSEVGTEEIREHALRGGKRLFYPKLGIGTELFFVQVENLEELKPGRFGILEPTGGRIMTKQDEDGLVVFVPGVAFDLEGSRLGRGKGWYDRALARFGEGVKLVALAYEFQVVEALPTERWDQKVHHIITERRVIDCGDFPSDSGWVS